MTLNNQIIAYLTVNNIAFTNEDYETGQPEGEADQILSWNIEKLGLEPTQVQLDSAYPIWLGQQIQAQNKQQASTLLLETDWVELPSVSDINNIPYLLNKAEFIAYRIALRVIVVNPINAVFPVKPISEWVK